MTTAPLFTVTDMSAIPALQRYAVAQGLRGKDIIETVRKVVRYWVSFALHKIPKGDPKKIRDSLTQIVTTYSKVNTRNVRSATRVANRWRGTLAAKLVFLLDYQGARAAAGFGDIEGNYRRATLFTNRRSYAAGLMRSGLREAVMRLHNVAGANPGRLPKFKNQPGSYDEKFTESVTTIIVENWARAAGARSKSIAQLRGDAFSSALPEVERMIADFLAQDMKKAAQKEGFQVAAA